MLGGEVGSSGFVTVNGLAGNRSVEGLRQGLMAFVPPGQIDFRVAGVDRVFCPALTALHPIGPAYGVSGGPRLGLQMDGKARLHDGEPVRVRLVMPDFTAHLRVRMRTTVPLQMHTDNKECTRMARGRRVGPGPSVQSV